MIQKRKRITQKQIVPQLSITAYVIVLDRLIRLDNSTDRCTYLGAGKRQKEGVVIVIVVVIVVVVVAVL